MNLVGIGYDVHRLVADRKLVVGGVEIPHTKGLDGHSDADVLLHAIADAALGAIGERDIGYHFPNSDEKLRGISSMEILRRVALILSSHHAHVINVDATLIAQEPQMAPHVPKMRENIGKALRLPSERVGVKATTNEMLGFLGRGEGIAAMAVVSVERHPFVPQTQRVIA